MIGALRDALAASRPGFVALALLVYAISVPLVAWRWRVMLAGVTGRRSPLGPLVLATLASSFVNNVTPTGRLGGEACRVIALVRLRFATASSATVAIAYERISEAPAVLVIAFVTLLVLGRISLRQVHLAAAILAALVLIGAGVILRAPVVRAWRFLRSRIKTAASVAIAPSTLVAGVLISTAIWALDVLRLNLVAGAFHAPIGLPQAAMLSAITIVAGIVPTIGGLGPIEGGLVAGLVGLGVAPAEAVGITLVERAISYGVATVSGLGALSLLGGRTLWNAARAGLPESSEAPRST